MPFQVVYNIFKVPPGVIAYFNAGEDQVAICDTSIILEALVIGNPVGHTFEWEGPISGTPVGVVVTFPGFPTSGSPPETTPRAPDTVYGGWTPNIVSPPPFSRMQLYYTNEGPGALIEDKVWRFWIDRGQPTEQFEDVVIFGTPTSKQYCSGVAEPLNRTPRTNYVDRWDVNNSVGCRAPVLSYLRGFGDAVQDGVDKNGTADFPHLTWNEPCLRHNIIQYIVQEKTSSDTDWVTTAIKPASDPRVVNSPTLGATYRVISVAWETNSGVSSYASNSVYIQPIPNSHHTTGENVFLSSPQHPGGAGGVSIEGVQMPGYTVTLYTKKIFAAPGDFDPSDTYPGGATTPGEHVLVPYYNATLFTLKLFAAPGDFDPSDTYPGGASTPLEHVQIIDYDVLDLTGGGIGGGP